MKVKKKSVIHNFLPISSKLISISSILYFLYLNKLLTPVLIYNAPLLCWWCPPNGSSKFIWDKSNGVTYLESRQSPVKKWFDWKFIIKKVVQLVR